MFFDMPRSFPPQGLCTCGSWLSLEYCCKGLGNTPIWPGQLFLLVVHPLVSRTLHSRQTEWLAFLLIMWVPLCGLPSFPQTFNLPRSNSNVLLLYPSLHSIILGIRSSSDFPEHTLYHLCSYHQWCAIVRRAWVLESGNPRLEYLLRLLLTTLTILTSCVTVGSLWCSLRLICKWR